MKGVIAMCMASMVIEKFGKPRWEEILQDAGLPRSSFFMATQDIEDQLVMRVVSSACKVLNISGTEAAEAFGDFWVNEFAPKTYAPFYKGMNSSREFLSKLDKIHVTATQTIHNARPPRFDYEWKNDRTLLMTYKSDRGLMEFFLGLVKGVGKHFNEKLEIRHQGANKVEITFPA